MELKLKGMFVIYGCKNVFIFRIRVHLIDADSRHIEKPHFLNSKRILYYSTILIRCEVYVFEIQDGFFFIRI